MIAQSERRVGGRPAPARRLRPVHDPEKLHVRRVEAKDGKFFNGEFSTFEAVKDPGKAAKKVQ